MQHKRPAAERAGIKTVKRRPRAAVTGSRWATDAALWTEERLGLKLDPTQRTLLGAGGNRLILNCSRQWGKSTVSAAKALHTALFREGTLTVVVSPTERQSAEFVKKAKDFLPLLGMKGRGDGVNRTSLVLPNGSRMVGLPGTEGTIRGYSAAALVVIDEASRVKDEQYKAVMPMLATTDGDMWVMSTPRGKRGFFYEIWANGAEQWKRVSVPATECPRIQPAFLEKQRVDMGPEWFRQEYLCEFVDVNESLFDRDVLMASVKETVKPLWGGGG
jgi:hypothetical protein